MKLSLLNVFVVAFSVGLLLGLMLETKQLKEELRAQEKLVTDLQRRLDYTSMRQALLDVKLRVMTGDIKPQVKAPTELEDLRGLPQ